MTVVVIIIGAILGVILGIFLPTIPYTASQYLAIGIVASLDSVFGGLASNINKSFNAKVFITGFFLNAILAMLLTYLGERLNVDIYLAAVIVFVGRIFNNLGIIRRYYVNKWATKDENKKEKIEEKNVEI